MNAESLSLLAVEYLRYKMQCPLVSIERGPFTDHLQRPDVVGWFNRRKVIEMEIKITLADLKRESKKRKHIFDGPHYLFYFVPEKIADKALTIIEESEWGNKAGLLTIPEHNLFCTNIYSKKRCEARHKNKLSNRYFLNMLKAQTGTLFSLCQKNRSLKERVRVLEKEVIDTSLDVDSSLTGTNPVCQ